MVKKVAIICFLFGSIFASETKTEFIKPDKVFIGTPVQMDFKVYAEDSLLTPAVDTLNAYVVKTLNVTSQRENGKKVSTLRIDTAPFDTGLQTFPAVDLKMRTAAGDTLFLKSDSLQITVESVLPDSLKAEMQKSIQNPDSKFPIKDIFGLRSVKLGFIDYAVPVILLAGLVCLLIWLLRKLKKKEPAAKEAVLPTETRPAWLIAKEMLQALQRKQYLQNGNFLDYYFGLSYILRFFLEKNYGFNAVEMTTFEIREVLVAEEKREILEFLKQADMIKFAKQMPTVETAEDAETWLETYLLRFEKEEFAKGENHA